MFLMRPSHQVFEIQEMCHFNMVRTLSLSSSLNILELLVGGLPLRSLHCTSIHSLCERLRLQQSLVLRGFALFALYSNADCDKWKDFVHSAKRSFRSMNPSFDSHWLIPIVYLQQSISSTKKSSFLLSWWTNGVRQLLQYLTPLFFVLLWLELVHLVSILIFTRLHFHCLNNWFLGVILLVNQGFLGAWGISG